MAFDIYGSVDPGTERGIHRIAEYLALRKGVSISSERPRLFTVLSHLVLQRTAVVINRSKLNISPCRMLIYRGP